MYEVICDEVELVDIVLEVIRRMQILYTQTSQIALTYLKVTSLHHL